MTTDAPALEPESQLEKWDAIYLSSRTGNPATAPQYSPAESNLRELGTVTLVHGANNVGTDGGMPAAHFTRPPNPSAGGKPGMVNALGWTQGISPSRRFAQLLTGRVLRVPSMGVNPVSGPVGFSNRQGRLEAAVHSQFDEPVPSAAEVAAMFTRPNPLDAELREMGVS